MQTFLNRHIEKIRVPTRIQLITLIHSRPSLDEQVNKCTVNNCRANLALDIVPSDRQLLVLELTRPLLLRSYELRNTINKATPCIQCRLCIEPCTLATPNRKIIHQNIGLRIAQLLRHINGFRPLLVIHVEDLPHMRRNPIEYGTRFHRHVHVWHIADLHDTVRLRENRLAKVPADLFLVDLEGGNEGNVLDRVVAELGMHESCGKAILGRRILPIILNALYQGARTVANASKGNLDLSHTFLGQLATRLFSIINLGMQQGNGTEPPSPSLMELSRIPLMARS